MIKTHYTYIIRCSDDSLYTGYTTDVSRRVEEHNTGLGAKYTRSRTPVVLKRVEFYDSKSNAMSREYEINQLSKKKKESLVKSNQVTVKF